MGRVSIVGIETVEISVGESFQGLFQLKVRRCIQCERVGKIGMNPKMLAGFNKPQNEANKCMKNRDTHWEYP